MSLPGPHPLGASRKYQFGQYELDLDAGFLRSGGREVSLRAKSFEVLAYLVERHGRLVAKAELIESVWRDAAVTDNSLSQCLLDIRRALDDDAQQFVRTVARRGYVFAAPVTIVPAGFPRRPADPAPKLVEPPAKRFNWKLAGVAALALILIATALTLLVTHRRPAVPEPPSFTQLTNFTDSAVAPALSSDGRLLAFYRGDNAFLTSGQIYVKLLPSGQPVQLTHDPRLKYGLAFSPDGSQIAYTAFGYPPGFNTYIIPSLGGEPRLLLSNAAGLSWLDPHTVLFSEVKNAPNMGVVTANEDRSGLREIYFPAYQRRMAHYSYPSPDRRWLLLAEMEPRWLPCRLVPFAGGSTGRQVGPAGECMSAAWSPDGKWMYFSVLVAGRRHLWRQSFPDGQPEQITSGPEEQDGLAMAPDGRSLVTSISMQQTAVWVHDAAGDRPISTQGFAATPNEDITAPRFTAGGQRLYYLLRNAPEAPAELWRWDLQSNQSQLVLPGVPVYQFDISNDEREVLYTTGPPGSPMQLWLASLDRSTPPRRLAAAGVTYPYFGPDGQLIFGLRDRKANYLSHMHRDAARPEKLLATPIIYVDSVSPDRRLVLALISALPSPDPHKVDLVAVPAGGGPPRRICYDCDAHWSPDGKNIYLGFPPSDTTDSPGKTVRIPLAPNQTLPPLPQWGFRTVQDGLAVPGATLMEQRFNVAFSSDPAVYAYIKSAAHANLFRIQLP